MIYKISLKNIAFVLVDIARVDSNVNAGAIHKSNMVISSILKNDGNLYNYK